MHPRPAIIILGVFALILITIIVALGGIVLASALVPGESPKEGKLGLIFLIPVLWLWKRFFIWCGLKFQ